MYVTEVSFLKWNTETKKRGARGRTYGEIRLRYVKDGTSRDTPSILTYHKEQ